MRSHPGTYNATTGVVTLTLASPVTVAAGSAITISSLTGTGGFASLDGNFKAVSASGNTLTYQAATGLAATTISGGALGGSTITLNAGQTLTPSVPVNTAPVTIDTLNTADSSLAPTAVSTEVNFSNIGTGANEQGTITLANGGNWASLGYMVGQGIFVGSSTDQNANGASFNTTTPAYYTVAAISGSVLTLQKGQTFTTEAGVTVNLAPVTINIVNGTDVSALTPVIPTNVIYGNANGAGTITLANGASWSALGYTSGQGIFIGSATDPNANGATFNGGNYYTVASINSDAVASGTYNSTTGLVTLTLSAPVTVTAGAAIAISALTGTGGFAGLDGTFTAISASGTTLTYKAATGLGATSITGGSLGGSTITLQSGQTMTTSVTIDASQVTATAAATTSTQVTFGNVGGAGTITLTGGGSWTSLGYTVGQGIFVGSSSNANANGTTFNAGASKPYYTIEAINGSVVTLAVGQTLTAGTATVNLAPVTISLPPALIPTGVTFANLSNGGTITRVDGENWADFGYTVGDGIYLGVADWRSEQQRFDFRHQCGQSVLHDHRDQRRRPHGDRQDAQAQKLTFTPETDATLNVAPVAINLNADASAIKFVIIAQNRDVAIAPTGTVTATAGGFIYLGSQVTLDLNTIVAGGDARIKTQADVINDASRRDQHQRRAGFHHGHLRQHQYQRSLDRSRHDHADGRRKLGKLRLCGRRRHLCRLVQRRQRNGASFNSNAPAYYTIAAIGGDEITLEAEQVLTAGTTSRSWRRSPSASITGINHSYLTPAGCPTT